VQAIPLAESAAAQLKAAGIERADLVEKSPENGAFGDSEAIFRIGSLLLRFVRERGQEFIDISGGTTADRFHQFSDIEIAMGWSTIEEELAKREPEQLSQVLDRVSRHLAELDGAFSNGREQLTHARIERAARERGEAFVRRLQR
jgi:hypothetical protein